VTTARTVTLMGLPRTGKSTYLGALWMIIQDDRAPEIREVDIRGDRAYLQRLGEQVAQLQTVKRTEVDSDDGLELTVELGTLGEVVLQIPDLSGETLRLLVEDRTWHDLLVRAITRSDALLLFVHPNRLRVPTRTNFTASVLAELLTTVSEDAEDSPPDLATTDQLDVDRADVDTDRTEAKDATATPTFAPATAATAAKLIDAIENILDAREEEQILKVAVVVSAWDEVVSAWPTGEGGPTPQAWLEQRLPAVWRVLQANTHRLDVAIFGVSAIGGRLPDDREELKMKGGVFDRAYALDADGASIAFVAPIEWALR
jgi:hypothetical protein